MTAPTIEQLPVRVPGATLLPPLVHSGCSVCTGKKRMFCGHEVADVLPPSAARKTTCAVCVELEKSHDWGAHFWGRS